VGGGFIAAERSSSSFDLLPLARSRSTFPRPVTRRHGPFEIHAHESSLAVPVLEEAVRLLESKETRRCPGRDGGVQVAVAVEVFERDTVAETELGSLELLLDGDIGEARA
jgi:hypothetical protein